VTLPLAAALWLPAQDGMAWLTEACAPWPCDPFLRVQVGDGQLFLPVDNAGQVLDALSALLTSATPGEEVTR
jgi:hypothetical protein